VVAEAFILAYGGVVHVIQLTDGWPPYPWAPMWLAVYFVSLTALDPLAAWLLFCRRRAGLYFGALVLLTNALANGYASYCLPVGTTASRVGQALISCSALGSLLVAVQTRPWMWH
jgi:hypothetical protein